MTVMENHIRMTDNEIKRIQSCGNIAYYNPVNYGYAKGEQLTKGNPIAFIHGEKHTEDNNMGAVTALRYSALETDLQTRYWPLPQADTLRKQIQTSF